MTRRTPLRRTGRSLIILVVVLIQLAAGLYAVDLWRDRRQRLASFEREATRVAALVEQRAARSLLADDLTLLRVVDRLADVSWATIGDDVEAWRYLAGLVEAGVEVRSIWLADRKGYIRLSSREFPSRPTYVGDADYVRVHAEQDDADAGRAAGTLYVGAASKRRPRGEGHAMILSRSVRDAQGRYRGTVAATVTLGRFNDVYRSLGLPPHARVALVSDNGHVIVGYPDRYWPATVSVTGGPFAPEAPVPASGGVFYGDPANQPFLSDLVWPGPSGDPGRYVVAYRRVENFPLSVVVVVPLRSVLAPWREHAVETGAIVMAALSPALLALLLMGLRLRGRDRGPLDAPGNLDAQRKAAFEAVGDGWWWYDVADERLTVAGDWAAAKGIDAGDGRDAYQAADGWMSRIDGRDRVHLREALRDHAAGRTDAVSSEFRVRRRDGRVLWLWARGRVVDGERAYGGKILTGTVTDVTARMEGTGGLAQRYEDMCEVQRMLGLGYWSWFVDSERLQWSDVLFRSVGIEPTPDGTLSAAQFRSMVHPNDREAVRDKLLSSLKGGRESLRFRILRADGAVRYLHGTAIAVQDGDRTVRLVGAIQDATEQVMALRLADPADGGGAIPPTVAPAS